MARASLMRGALRWSRRVASAIGFLVVLVTVTPVTRWWTFALAGDWYDPKGDVLIVLTGSTVTDMIGLDSYWRSVYAVRFFKDEPYQEILITGAGPGTPAAITMRDFVVSQGVPAAVVRVETDSQSTRESAVNVAKLLAADPARYGGRQLVLMTSDFHATRAYRAFRKAGVDVRPVPVPDVLKRCESLFERWGVFLDLVRETSKLGYYWARGWV